MGNQTKNELFLLPKFRSDKEVHASRILSMDKLPGHPTVVRILLMEPPGMHVDLSVSVVAGHCISVDGWLICDRAGSISFCPNKRFKESYSAFEDDREWGASVVHAIKHTLHNDKEMDSIRDSILGGSGLGKTVTVDIDLDAADFSDALMWLKEGKKVSRKGWNAGGQYCWMVPASDDSPYGAHFALMNAQNIVVPWQPSVGDVLACDWVVVS